ncbi:hypothetical protein GCM10022207_92360 [Streptomyces lannensis]|uniref:Uncharacterized protein n=1 Tax=Streptomyces lannensis TaxID=766498 RepID=A0ABP7LVB6_9ACTN
MSVLGFEYFRSLQCDNVPHQRVLVGVVAVQLRLTRSAGRPDIVKSRESDASDMHHVRSSSQDALTSRPTSLGQPGIAVITHLSCHVGKVTLIGTSEVYTGP